MSRLTQLEKLANKFPIYFTHTYYKELERAQIRQPQTYDQGCQGEQPEVEGEWTESERSLIEKGKFKDGLKEGIGVSKDRRKGVR